MTRSAPYPGPLREAPLDTGTPNRTRTLAGAPTSASAIGHTRSQQPVDTSPNVNLLTSSQRRAPSPTHASRAPPPSEDRRGTRPPPGAAPLLLVSPRMGSGSACGPSRGSGSIRPASHSRCRGARPFLQSLL
ncbi:hypothetical protein C8Q70DRAFT_315124 [Cubamyces menziesii]|nr:hypothetical protein C8Q70DRAFT_315124 [Cubamyces menziesii]